MKKFLKKVMFWFVVCLIFAGIVQYFRWAYPTERIVTKEVLVERAVTYPVLERIANCESGNTQYDKNGQVLLRGNNDKTVDVGKYQINSRWFAKATELGLDLTKEKDNEAFAIYLYKTFGTEPWVWSKKCWNK